MKPGKKSFESLKIVPQLPVDRRPEPIRGLTRSETKFWRGIVRSLPTDWFRPADLPILAAYCQAVAQHDEAGAQLAKSTLILTDRWGKSYRNPLLAIQHQSALRAALLAGKLRLTQSSRYNPRAAASATNATPAGAKPWQK